MIQNQILWMSFGLAAAGHTFFALFILFGLKRESRSTYWHTGFGFPSKAEIEEHFEPRFSRLAIASANIRNLAAAVWVLTILLGSFFS